MSAGPTLPSLEMGYYQRRKATPAQIFGGLAATFSLHILIVLAVVIGTWHGEQAIEEDIEPHLLEFEKVELLALGEEKPPEALPRIANPEPVTKEPDKVILEQPKEPVVQLEKEKPKEAEEKEEKDRKKRMLDALSALHNPNRPTNEDTPEGSEKGVVGGTISDAAMENLMGTYAAKLMAELTRTWEVPSTIDESEVAALSNQVQVYVRLSESGDIVSYKFTKKSDNDQFNASIDRVLKRFQLAYGGRKLPMPDDPAVKDAVLKQGLNLKTWEFTGR